MKPTFKIIATLFLIGVMYVATATVSAEESTKEYHESWSAKSIESLWILNRFGDVKVKNDGGSEITIDVVIKVEARNEKRVNELLDAINVSFSRNGKVIKATTRIENDFKSQQKFSIDYVVNIPADKNLRIENKYGNAIVNRLTGNGDFRIQYGNFTANELSGEKVKLALAYGNATISSAGKISVQVKYSPISFGDVKNLILDSKYSDISVDEAKNIYADSKYDKLTFDKVDTIKCATKYSHIRIDELAKSFKVDAGYGSIKIDKVLKGFDEISITNSYGQISVGLYDLDYSIKATCNYCDVSYPEHRYEGHKIQENHTRKIDGKVGSGEGGVVRIQSRYGDIKLRD